MTTTTTATSTTAATTTTTTDAPSTSMAVARAGQALSADLLQELAATVATTAQRERLRKQVILALGVAGGLAAGIGITGGTTVPANLPTMLFAICCIAPILPLTLAWGVRNRALLNAAAHNAAVDHMALARAVRLVEKRTHGPSSALQMALQAALPEARH